MPRSIRDIAITLILVGGGLLILFSSGKKSDSGVAARVFYTVMRPVQQAVFGIHSRVSNAWHSYVALVGIRQDNQSLIEEVRRLKNQNTVLMQKEGENRRLRKLLDLKAQHEFPSLVAQVIGEDAVGWYRTFFINRGSEDGVLTNMPVTVAEGVVGRVSKSSEGMSQVILITDPNFSVDCRVARTRDRGVLSGSLDRGCVLRYLRLDADVRPGDEVVTSGLDNVFPRGLNIGKVEAVRKSDPALFLEARVTPSVDFAAVEEVLVVLGQKGGFDVGPGLEEKR